MRFLADENFPGAAVAALEAAGHDVVWVRVSAPGIADADVLAKAQDEGRILPTFDKDFGELVANATVAEPCGIILFRIPPPRSEDATRRLATVLSSRQDWAEHFSVVEAGRVRMRPYS